MILNETSLVDNGSLRIANAPAGLIAGLTNLQLIVANAIGPVTFSVSGLGLGLSLSSSGLLSGLALVGSLLGVVITAVDSAGRKTSITLNLTIS